MPRLLFEKKDNAIWISHLDLMRVFQRAFNRGNLPLTHTQGFNPRPSVSIALPLSVGISSQCELLDFELDNCDVTMEEICSRLNANLVDGVHVLDVYEEGRKIRDLSLLRCVIELEYDNGCPLNAMESISALLKKDAVIVPKKTKNGIQDQNIIPMIPEFKVMEAGEKCICIEALICCQNPTLNPAQIILAIEMNLPELKPDFAKCSRVEIYDSNQNVFR